MHKSLLFVLIALLLTGCGGLRGSGNVTTTTREVSPFSAIDVAGIGEILVTQGQAESLTVETDDNLQAIVLSEVRGDTLYLSIKPNSSVGKITKMLFTVTVRDLQRITLAGATRMSVSEISGDQLNVDDSGLGALTIAGKVTEQHVTLSGAGSYDGAALISDRATVTLSGLGSMVVNVRSRLDATISGSGKVEYIGSPEVIKQISGLGTIKQRAP